MNRFFSITASSGVPDGTWVCSFLNAKDSQSDLAFDLLDGFSLAASKIDPNSCSKIHVMPCVSQVSFVRSGSLAVRMKGPDDTQPYILRLAAGQAVLTGRGVFFQLINEGSEPCEVLYIVSLACVFEMGPVGTVVYDDAVVLEEGWDDLAASGWRTARLMATAGKRADAMRRLSDIKRKKAML